MSEVDAGRRRGGVSPATTTTAVVTVPDLPVLDLEQRRKLFRSTFGSGFIPDDELAALELSFEIDEQGVGWGTVWLRWRHPGRLSRGGVLVNRRLAIELGLVEG